MSGYSYIDDRNPDDTPPSGLGALLCRMRWHKWVLRLKEDRPLSGYFNHYRCARCGERREENCR